MSFTPKELVAIAKNTEHITASQIADIQSIAENYPFFQMPFLLLTKLNKTAENIQNVAIRTYNRPFLKFFIEGNAYKMPSAQAHDIDQVDLQPDTTNAFHALADHSKHSDAVATSFDPEVDEPKSVREIPVSEDEIKNLYIDRTDYDPFADNKSFSEQNFASHEQKQAETETAKSEFEEILKTYRDPYESSIVFPPTSEDDEPDSKKESPFSEILRMQQDFLKNDAPKEEKKTTGIYLDTDGDGELEFFQGKFVEDDEAHELTAEQVSNGVWVDIDGDGELDFFQGKFVEHDDLHPTSADEVAQGIWLDTDGDGVKEFYEIKKFESGNADASMREQLEQGVWIDTDGDGELEFFQGKFVEDDDVYGANIEADEIVYRKIDNPDVFLHKPENPNLDLRQIFAEENERDESIKSQKSNFFKKFGIDKEEAD